MVLNENYKMANGMEIPKLGLGTWMIEGEACAQAIRDAAKLGYRHFDTAHDYMNQKEVGEGIRTCGIPREELFISTKISAFAKSYEAAKKDIEEDLVDLGIGYIDLLLIHAPEPWTDFRGESHYFTENLDAWRAMEEFVDAGKIKAIGVANFLPEDLDNIIRNCRIKPVVNQVLMHIGNTPFDVLEYCNENEIVIQAYSPIAHGEALKSTAIRNMADKYHVSVSQLCIRYCLELGTVPIPKTANPEHMKNNADVDFVISSEDLETLKKIPKIENYGDFSLFPVYGGQMDSQGNCTPGKPY